MQVVLDLEANGLKPTEIWCIVCKDLSTCHKHIFRNLTRGKDERKRFLDFSTQVSCWIGHNLLGYDWPVLANLLGLPHDPSVSGAEFCDTFILSKLIDYPRQRHSVKDYGLEFDLYKGEFTDFSRYSDEMVEYCCRDVDITHKIYEKYKKYLDNPKHHESIQDEHTFQLSVNNLRNNGFAFDISKAKKLLEGVTKELDILDKEFSEAFPARLKLIREIHPKVTKHGSLSKTDFRFETSGDLSGYNGGPFSRCAWESFNPGSPKQVVGVLHAAGWSPVDKTDGHVDAEREVNKLKRQRRRSKELDILLEERIMILNKLKLTGWKINEENISTLPASAPPAARLLSKRILYEARRKTLTEWLSLVTLYLKVEKKSIDEIIIRFGGTKNNEEESTTLNLTTASPSKIMIDLLKNKGLNVNCVEEIDHSLLITIIPQAQSAGYSVVDAIAALDGLRTIGLQYLITSARVHGEFAGLGAWTHRMAHRKPNLANITNAVRVSDGKEAFLGKELRSCWIAPKGRILVGVDAEAIQLRVFAHLINDPVLIDAIVNGDKKLGTDPHSLNQAYFGSYCKTRNAAKHSLYAMFFGGTSSMLSTIMGCTRPEAQEAIDALILKYPGLAHLQQEVFPIDARRGYFIGLDGRKVRIPGETVRDREHLCMSGYLQNGEKVIMAKATMKFEPKLKDYDTLLVDLVHDEWQNECPNDYGICEAVAKLECQSLVDVGVDLGLNCPLAGSYLNDAGKPTFGKNWYQTH